MKHSGTTRRALLTTTACLAMLMSASNAAAQEADDEEELENLEEIVVTGSRIRRSNLVAPTPVTIIDAEALSNQGLVNIADALNQLPALGSTFTNASSTGFIGTTGLSFLDLRRLGTDRTLVLVNGKRHVGSQAGSAAVDINSIPQELIDRIEVITGGASSVYGADAVSGVVNFITKTDYEGVSLYAQAGDADQGNAFSYTTRFIAGGNFSDGKGNAVVSAEWSDTEGFLQSDRSFARRSRVFLDNPDDTDGGTSGANDGIPDELLFDDVGLNFITAYGLVNFFFDENGSFLGSANNPSFIDENGQLLPFDSGGITDGGNSVGGDTLRRAAPGLDGSLNGDIQRIIVNGQVNYELTDFLNVYLETKYVNTQAESSGTPAFTTGAGLTVQRDNAFITPEIESFLSAEEAALGGTIGEFTLAQINPALGDRGDEIERQLFRGVFGFRGDFDNGIDYDVSFVYGRATVADRQTNNRINDRFFAAVDAVGLTADQAAALGNGVSFVRAGSDGTDVLTSGSATPVAGDIVCRAVVDNPDNAVPSFAANGCVPLNIINGAGVSEEALNFVNANGFLNEEVEQRVITANMSGDTSSWFELPAGAIGFAAGIEYREEQALSVPTTIDQLGLTFLNVIPVTEGGFDVFEGYAEVAIPLLKDLPFAEELTLEAAGRLSDYSTVGGTEAWSVRAIWQPVQDVRFRATYSEAVRAPNISELFGPQSQTFLGFEDPCDIANLDDGPDPALRAANCAALGLPADFEEDETRGTQPGTIGGNPNLREETADTFTVGAVFTPRWVPGLSLTVDYYDIEIDDAISAPGLQDVLDNCVDADSINNSFCPLITRSNDPGDFGQVVGFAIPQQNIASLTAKGIDFSVNYSFDIADLGLGDGNYGTIDLRAIGTYLIERDDFEFQEFPDIVDEEKGELGDPEWAVNFNLNYQLDRFTFNYELRYLDAQLLAQRDVIAVNPDVQSPLTTGDTFFHDIQFRYQLLDELELLAGINNIGQKFPPAGLTGAGTGSAIFDTVGRFYYGGLRARF